MVVIGIFIVLALVLFAGAFISRRRFGLLGLALAAGATVSMIWSYDAGLLLAATGLVPEGPITNAITLAAIVLLPALLLLFHGYAYKNMAARIIGSIFFTILALAFLVEPIGIALPLEGVGAQAYEWLKLNKELIISVGLVFAVIDLFFTKPVKNDEKSHKK